MVTLPADRDGCALVWHVRVTPVLAVVVTTLPALTTVGMPGSASSAAPKAAESAANTAPGLISSAISLILAWSRLCSE